MTRYFVGRIAQALGNLLVITVALFLLVRLTGDPVAAMVPDASPEMHERLTASLKLDRPLHIQYVSYLQDIVHGDLGNSIRSKRPVATMLGETLFNTLQLGVSALAVTIVIAIPLGVYAAAWVGRKPDWFARAFAIFGQSVPAFWVGLMLILVFGSRGILPAGGKGTAAHLVMPSVTLALSLIAGLTRLTRSAMLEALTSDYVKMARLKGVAESKVLWIHALRNAGISILTFSSVIAISLLTGSVIAETVFSWPGLGRLLVQATALSDYPVVQGTVLLLSAMWIFGSLIVDVLYVYLNPEVRYD